MSNAQEEGTLAPTKGETPDAKEQPTFTALWWNIDQAGREQQYEATKWSARQPHVLDLIKRNQADVVGLVELRDLNGDTWRAFLGQLDAYMHVARPYCD